MNRPIQFTETERMWIVAEFLTFANDVLQKVREGNFKSYTPMANQHVDYIEQVILSGKPVNSTEFQGSDR